MRRVARVLSYGGCAIAVLLMSKYHASYVADTPYDFTGSFRFTWALAYIGVLVVATYAVGMPDQTRSRRQALWLAVVASVAATLATSAVQFAVGDALLPRFVVFGSALFLIPWQVAVAGLARDGRDRDRDEDRDEDRDRVLAEVGHVHPWIQGGPCRTLTRSNPCGGTDSRRRAHLLSGVVNQGRDSQSWHTSNYLTAFRASSDR